MSEFEDRLVRRVAQALGRPDAPPAALLMDRRGIVWVPSPSGRWRPTSGSSRLPLWLKVLERKHGPLTRYQREPS